MQFHISSILSNRSPITAATSGINVLFLNQQYFLFFIRTAKQIVMKLK